MLPVHKYLCPPLVPPLCWGEAYDMAFNWAASEIPSYATREYNWADHPVSCAGQLLQG